MYSPGVRSLIAPFDKVHLNRWERVFCGLLFCFSAWMMLRSFSYDHEHSKIVLLGPMWSDFGATLPLIRSFSMGDNWPPEYPIFPGLPIKYHYLFALIVGKLEAIGVPIDWAVNVPSIIGFFAILLMIYLLAKKWFGDPRIGMLGIAFFLLNGSMGFLQFFQKHPLSLSSASDIFSNAGFTAMGPWDRGNVLGTWHLLVYINQRHFVIALGILLSFVYLCHCLDGKSKKFQLYWALFFGLLIGVFPVFHKAVLLMFAVFMVFYFLLVPVSRLFLFTTGAVSVLVMCLLWLLSFNLFEATGVRWFPGFMIHGSLSFVNAVKFFWYQFGLHVVLIPIGYCLAPKRVKIALLPAFIVLIIAFLFRFAQDVMVGHKFFNLFLIVGQVLTAFVLVKAYDFASARFPRAKILSFGMASVLVFFLTFSGVIDFIAIVNKRKNTVRDVAANPEARWFAENTPRDAIILSSKYLYSPASVAGRKIFLGYGYFTTGAGYDTYGRKRIVDAIYSGGDRDGICRLLQLNNISYVDVEEFPPDVRRPEVNVEYFRENFTPLHSTHKGRYAVYTTEELCK
jgi:hypothetical protein